MISTAKPAPSQIFYTQASKFYETATQNLDPISTLKSTIEHNNEGYFLEFINEYSSLKDDERKEKVTLQADFLLNNLRLIRRNIRLQERVMHDGKRRLNKTKDRQKWAALKMTRKWMQTEIKNDLDFEAVIVKYA